MRFVFRCWILSTGIAAACAGGAEPAIIEAARSGSMEQLRWVLAHSEKVDVRGAQNQTALHEAASRCSPDAALELLRAGANQAALDDAGRTPLAIASGCKDPAVMNQLVRLFSVVHPTGGAAHKNGSADRNSRWTLQGAAARGDTNLAEMLLKLGTDVNAVNSMGDRALEVASRKPDARMVELLLKSGADVNLTTSSGTRVLHEAALGGDPRIIELLIRRGAAVDVPDKETAATPLHFAASFGRQEAARTLVEHGADVLRQDRRGRDALTLATDNGHRDIADMLRSSVKKPSPGQKR